jgi:hypothetical protein
MTTNGHEPQTGAPDLYRDDPAAEAQWLTNEIRHSAVRLWTCVARPYEMRAWEHMGYASWDDYVAGEFEAPRWRIPRGERGPVVALLRSAGMSTRAIASATGESQSTVQRATGQVNQSDSPDRVQGTDGRSHPARRAKLAEETVGARLARERKKELAEWRAAQEAREHPAYRQRRAEAEAERLETMRRKAQDDRRAEQLGVPPAEVTDQMPAPYRAGPPADIWPKTLINVLEVFARELPDVLAKLDSDSDDCAMGPDIRRGFNKAYDALAQVEVWLFKDGAAL